MSDDITIPPPGYYNPRPRASAQASGTYRTVGIAVGIIALVGVGALGASVVHFRSGPVPVIEADSRPIRVKPDNAGGMQIAGANNDILSGGNDTNDSKLAPAPEAPNPQALRAISPLAPPGAPPGASQVAPPVAAPAPLAVAPPKPKPVVPAAAPAPAHPAVHSKASIQLAALETEAAARAEWQTLQKRLPDVLAGHEPSISKTERAGKTYWRLRTAGFNDVAQAKAVCDKVRSKGASCSVAEF